MSNSFLLLTFFFFFKERKWNQYLWLLFKNIVALRQATFITIQWTCVMQEIVMAMFCNSSSELDYLQEKKTKHCSTKWTETFFTGISSSILFPSLLHSVELCHKVITNRKKSINTRECSNVISTALYCSHSYKQKPWVSSVFSSLTNSNWN